MVGLRVGKWGRVEVSNKGVGLEVGKVEGLRVEKRGSVKGGEWWSGKGRVKGGEWWSGKGRVKAGKRGRVKKWGKGGGLEKGKGRVKAGEKGEWWKR